MYSETMSDCLRFFDGLGLCDIGGGRGLADLVRIFEGFAGSSTAESELLTLLCDILGVCFGLAMEGLRGLD